MLLGVPSESPSANLPRPFSRLSGVPSQTCRWLGSSLKRKSKELKGASYWWCSLRFWQETVKDSKSGLVCKMALYFLRPTFKREKLLITYDDGY